MGCLVFALENTTFSPPPFLCKTSLLFGSCSELCGKKRARVTHTQQGHVCPNAARGVHVAVGLSVSRLRQRRTSCAAPPHTHTHTPGPTSAGAAGEEKQIICRRGVERAGEGRAAFLLLTSTSAETWTPTNRLKGQ